jgi:hypothetical protein
MFQVLLILSIVFSIYSIVVVAVCPVGWTPYGSNCYKFGLVAVPWPVCHLACTDQNAMMLCITDDITNAWLSLQTDITEQPSWIGLSDYGNVGTYTWVPRCSSTYTNWGIGQPNNLGIQNYAYLGQLPGGKWDTVQTPSTKICACQMSIDGGVSE